MGFIQKVRSKRAGDYDEITIKIGEEEQSFKVAPFTEEQKVAFFKLSGVPESYAFKNVLSTEKQSHRAKKLWREFQEWTSESHALLSEVTNIRDKRFVVELMLVLLELRNSDLTDLRVKQHKKSQYFSINMYLMNLQRNKNELLEKIERVEKRLAEQTAILSDWQPLHYNTEDFKQLIARGLTYSFCALTEDDQVLAAEIGDENQRVIYPVQKQKFMQAIAVPTPLNDAVAVELFDLFEMYNESIFTDCYKNVQRKQSAETAISRAQSELKLLYDELAEFDEKISFCQNSLAEIEKIKF